HFPPYITRPPCPIVPSPTPSHPSSEAGPARHDPISPAARLHPPLPYLPLRAGSCSRYRSAGGFVACANDARRKGRADDAGDAGRRRRRRLRPVRRPAGSRSEEHTSELQSRENLVCRLLLEKKKESTARLL